MKLKLFFLLVSTAVVSSCQFTETMVMNADGSGTMSVELDLSEMMMFSGMSDDETDEIKTDTIIRMKDYLVEMKDSISNLSEAEQQRLKKLESYIMHIKIDSEEQAMKYDISINFQHVSESNEILNALEQVENLSPSVEEDASGVKKEESQDIIGVAYFFENNRFRRDAYIKDEKLHKQQVDSLQATEAFFASSQYTLNYTFPKKIIKASNPNAVYSNDKKTIIIGAKFIDYFKDPDLLDLEVVLED